jgi:hypothetical protein
MSSSAFQEVNDSIRGLASTGPDSQMWEFFCECPDVACHTLVSLTLGQFDALRDAAPPAPILAAHHAAA